MRPRIIRRMRAKLGQSRCVVVLGQWQAWRVWRVVHIVGSARKDKRWDSMNLSRSRLCEERRQA